MLPAGGRHGRPADGRHSAQVEVNKRLYMSEEERHAGFEQVRQTLRELAEALLVQDLGLEGGSPPSVAPMAAHFDK
jgi:N-formylglutamate amidohydrolase